MPDTRRHRGPHPRDRELFGADAVGPLRDAVADLGWLLERGYPGPSALTLVGNRHGLRARQRIAVGRSACSGRDRAAREARRVAPDAVAGRPLVVDGLNAITTIEVALAGGVLLLGRDGCVRDMASFHGNYRLVHETERAVELLVATIGELRPAAATVLVDRPVSNSGRLAATIRTSAVAAACPVRAVVADGVDEALVASDAVVATADSGVLDACGPWLNLARLVLERHGPARSDLWLLDLSGG